MSRFEKKINDITFLMEGWSGHEAVEVFLSHLGGRKIFDKMRKSHPTEKERIEVVMDVLGRGLQKDVNSINGWLRGRVARIYS